MMPMVAKLYDRVIQHCAVMGTIETPVRSWKVHEPKPYAQYATSVTVSCVAPRKRTGFLYTIVPNNSRYLTIVSPTGQTVYDSRTDVPCDMTQWEATNARFQDNRPLTTIRTKEERDKHNARLALLAQPQ